MALIMAVSAVQGKRAGLHTATGIGAARFLHVPGSGLGLAALFTAPPPFLDIVRFAGAGYLLFWARRMLHSINQRKLTKSRHVQGQAQICCAGFSPTCSTPRHRCSAACFFPILHPQNAAPCCRSFSTFCHDYGSCCRWRR